MYSTMVYFHACSFLKVQDSTPLARGQCQKLLLFTISIPVAYSSR